MEIFVGNLADSVTPADLQRLFAGYGSCSGFLLIDRRINGRTAHCAYGVIEPDEEGLRAIRELNHHDLKGRPVMVMEHVTAERRRGLSGSGDEAPPHARPWIIEPAVTAERRQDDRRQGDRRQGERRVADRRSFLQQAVFHPSGEEPLGDHRVSQRRVGERRRGERRAEERRREP